ncbi:MAG: hypothetical protein ACKO96_25420, partial [Flammeovirgaceae bacterium]
MEKIKGIGIVALWLLGHVVCFSIYTVDRVISVFAPWQPMPKYLTWYGFVSIKPKDDKEKDEIKEKEKKEYNPFHESVTRGFFAGILILSYWASTMIFNDYPFLIAVAFDLCLIGVIVSFDNIKADRKAKNARKMEDEERGGLQQK